MDKCRFYIAGRENLVYTISRQSRDAERMRQMTETKRLYYEDVYKKEFTAKVLECREAKKGFHIILDESAFYPEGGGQPSDTGYLNDVKVKEVHEKEGELLHYTDQPMEAGTEVQGRIDWARRFDLMQQHSGEHMVSGLIHEAYGYDNVGFHMGSDTITIDLNGPLDEVQLADICACCGTHVTHTGEIGMVKLLSVEKFREGVRIEMICGKRVLDYLNMINEQNHQISVKLSAKMDKTAQAVERLQEENFRLKGQVGQLVDDMCRKEAERYAGSGSVLIFMDGMDADSVRKLADAVTQTCQGCCAVFSRNADGSYKYAMGEKDGDLRRFTKEMNEKLNGRGGGKPFFVQGSVQASEKEIRNFFEQ